MPRATKDVFGFEEMEKAFARVKKRYPNDADALLMAAGQAVRKNVRAASPKYEGPVKKGIKPGQLKNSWSVKKPKEYKGGKVRVVQIKSQAPHAHLVELGHKIYRGGKTRKNGKKMNAVQLALRGVKNLGFVKGELMLENSMKEARAKLPRDAENLMDRLIKEWEK